MPYSKQTWVDGSAPAATGVASAARMNHIEDGIFNAQDLAEDKVSGAGNIVTDWKVRPRIYANADGTWPSRVVPAGYTDAVDWDSLAIPGLVDPANRPPSMVTGDYWWKRKVS